MRYRPLGNTGMAISAVALTLEDAHGRRASDWISLVYAGLESGINAFYIAGQQAALLEGFAEAAGAVDRQLLFIALRLGWKVTNSGATVRDCSPDSLTNVVESVIARTGLGYLDAVILDDPNAEEFSPQALAALKQLKAAGKVRLIGVSGHDAATDIYISSGAFDLLATSFSLMSGWKERLRLKAAIERDMAVVGYGYHPDQVQDQTAKPGAWVRTTAANPLAGAGSYSFLNDTSKWSAEEICLAYAMTEPSLCSVQIPADRVEQIELLAKVTERELPPNVPAQIEMARFSPPAKAEMARRA